MFWIYTLVFIIVFAALFTGGGEVIAGAHRRGKYVSPGWLFFLGLLVMFAYMYLANNGG